MRKRITLSQIDVRKLSHGWVQFKLSRHEKELKYSLRHGGSSKREHEPKVQNQKEAKYRKNENCFQLYDTSKYHFLNLNARNATPKKKSAKKKTPDQIDSVKKFNGNQQQLFISLLLYSINILKCCKVFFSLSHGIRCRWWKLFSVPFTTRVKMSVYHFSGENILLSLASISMHFSVSLPLSLSFVCSFLLV